jgi:hypothetical protein
VRLGLGQRLPQRGLPVRFEAGLVVANVVFDDGRPHPNVLDGEEALHTTLFVGIY